MDNPFPGDPISQIEWLEAASLRHNHWNPNYVLGAELRLLELSIVRNGWIQPVLVSREGVVIDGFHRWMLSRESEPLRAKYHGMVPCVVMDIPEPEAMMLTVRINRAKGSHAAVRMSDLVKALIDVHGCDPEEVARGIGATRAEVDLLLQDSVFKARNLDTYRYSKAWVPHEDGRKSKEDAGP